MTRPFAYTTSQSLNNQFKEEFPQRPDIYYLNHAAVSPWPGRAANALCEFARENATQGSADYPQWTLRESNLRQQLASLINAPQADDIALLKSTSEALSLVAYGIDWQPGDNIVIPASEFPSNRIVWESLSKFGVELRTVDISNFDDTDNPGCSDKPETALIEACDNNTRLLSTSSVQYANGLTMNLSRLGEYCRSRHILFCVDAIQSLGALAFDAQAIKADFVMADAHKWMMGPEGIALFYVRPEIRDSLSLNQYGWHMVEALGDFDRADWQPALSARRFECGSPNTTGQVALHASLSLLLEVGLDAVTSLVKDNTHYLVDLIRSHPELSLVSAQSPERISGITSFHWQNGDQQSLYKSLMDNGVICALRHNNLRFSPHFYTSANTLETAIQITSEQIQRLKNTQ